MSELLEQREGHVAVFTFNRPEKMNTISGTMLSALSAGLVAADRDPDVRAIVITGTGRAFCAGLDLKDQRSGDGNRAVDEGRPRRRPGELDLRDAPFSVIHHCDTPTIAALNGAAAGYGMDLALGCDLRVAAESSRLAPVFVKRGVLPESGGTWWLPRLVGYAKAAEIALLGDQLSAQQCLELGLVNRVVPDGQLMEAALELGNRIAANAPLAVRATKRMLRQGANETFDAHVERVYLQLMPLMRTDDFQEGIDAFLNRRPPEFEGS